MKTTIRKTELVNGEVKLMLGERREPRLWGFVVESGDRQYLAADGTFGDLRTAQVFAHRERAEAASTADA